MPDVSVEVVALLNTLLPGFFAAWIFYGLTAYSKPPPFERTVQALTFNIMIIPLAASSRDCCSSPAALRRSARGRRPPR